MARQVAIPCEHCGRKFGGQDTFNRHRYIAGDRYACRSDQELLSRGFWRDRSYVWHRGPMSGQTSFLPVSPGVTWPTSPRLLARTTDPITSKLAAKAIAYRTGTAKARLLEVYRSEPDGLTDEEAAARAGMSLYEATKRCSDLLTDGWIVADGVRKGSSGLDRRVCRVVEQVSA